MQREESKLHRTLKSETRALHEQLDSELGLLAPDLTIHRYGHVLRAFLGFYSPMERGLARLVATTQPVGFSLRARVPLIERDLIALGLSRRQIAATPLCTVLPRLTSVEDLAGCLYVLEGACLGGQVIARALRRRFGLERSNGASFFIGDAEATGMRWLRVLAWLDGVAQEAVRCEVIVTSARATFQTFACWLAQQGASRPQVEEGDGRSHRL
jgi:heme oxygenase